MTDEPEPIEGGFSRRGLGWIIGSVAVSFVAAVLLGVYGKDLDRRPSPKANTFSYSALGHRALAEFLRGMGLGVVSRQAPAGGVGPGRPLILAEPGETDRLKVLRQEAAKQNAALVLVLPKWSPGPPQKKKPEWLAAVRLTDTWEVRRIAGALDDWLGRIEIRRSRGGNLLCSAFYDGWQTSLRIEVEPVQLLGPVQGLAPVVQCSGGILIAQQSGGTPGPATYLISDPDLLNNHGLGHGDNAELVYRFLTQQLAARGVVFDETTHGFERTPGLLAESLRFPMVLGVLQGLVLLGVVLWAGMGRFGKPLPPPPALAAGKEILIDNTAKLLAGGGHAADGLDRYFRQTTRAVAAHYFLAPDLPDDQRLARLQRITDARGGKLNLAELERSLWRLPDGRPGEEQAKEIAQRLYDWRVEMTNGH